MRHCRLNGLGPCSLVLDDFAGVKQQARCILPARRRGLHGEGFRTKSSRKMDNGGWYSDHSIKTGHQSCRIVVIMRERGPRVLNEVNLRVTRSEGFNLF